MQIDIVGHAAIGAVVEVELHYVALANANELTWDFTPERPERVVHSVREAPDELLGLEVDRHTCRVIAGDGRWNRRSVGEDGLFRSDDRIAASGLTARQDWKRGDRKCQGRERTVKGSGQHLPLH